MLVSLDQQVPDRSGLASSRLRFSTGQIVRFCKRQMLSGAVAILLALWSAGCAPASESARNTTTSLPPASTLPSDAIPAATAPASPVPTSTPYPPSGAPIEPENTRHVALLARLGKGAWTEIAFSPDGRLLAVASGIGVYLYDAADLTEVGFLPTNAFISSMAFSPDGRLLAAGAMDMTVQLWHVARRVQVRTLAVRCSIWSIAFSPDSRLLAAGSECNEVQLWNVARGALVHTFTEPTRDVTSVAFSPDGRLLAAGAEDDTVRLWDVASRALVRTLVAKQTNRVESVTFSPDGRLLAVASRIGVYLYDAANLTETGFLPTDDFVWSVSRGIQGVYPAWPSRQMGSCWPLVLGTALCDCGTWRAERWCIRSQSLRGM
jgi:WD40 repeat protein